MKTSKDLKKFQRKMRSKPTEAEDKFSKRLFEQKINFKQQMILGFFICDFVLPDKMLVIEIDGPVHEEHYIYDKIRTTFIERTGLTVIRLKNEDVEKFDLYQIHRLPNYPEKYFRSALGKGNSLKGKSMLSRKKT